MASWRHISDSNGDESVNRRFSQTQIYSKQTGRNQNNTIYRGWFQFYRGWPPGILVKIPGAPSFLKILAGANYKPFFYQFLGLRKTSNDLFFLSVYYIGYEN